MVGLREVLQGEAAAVHDAQGLIETLDDRRLPLGGVILNRVLPSYLLDDEAASAAATLVQQCDVVRGLEAPRGDHHRDTGLR